MSQVAQALVTELWSMAPLGPLALVATGIAAGVGAWLLRRAMKLSINAAAFGEMISKLLNAGNPERAQKLCSAAGPIPQVQLVQIGLEARAFGDSSLIAMREAYPAALARLQRGLFPALFVAAMAALLSAALLATHMDSQAYPLALGMALFDAGVAAFAASRWLQASRDLDLLVQRTGDV